MPVMIIPDNTCYAPPQWLHGQDPVWADNVKLCHTVPRLPLSHHSQTQSIGMQIFLFFYQLKKKMKIHIEKIEKEWKGKTEKEEIIIMNEIETNHRSSDEFHLPKRIIRKNSSICIPAEN